MERQETIFINQKRIGMTRETSHQNDGTAKAMPCQVFMATACMYMYTYVYVITASGKIVGSWDPEIG